MNTLESIGNTVLGITVFIGFIVATVLFFTLGAKVAFTIAPFINRLAGALFILNCILLVSAIIPKARSGVGMIIYISSYIYGLSAWIYGLGVTLALWGWSAVVIGLLLGGIGVVPIGIFAAAFNAHWDIFWTLLLTVILTYGARATGHALASSANTSNRDDVIDIKPDNSERSWGDLE